MANKHIKRCSAPYIVKKVTLEQQQYATTHLLAWPKSGPLRVPNASEDVEQYERSFIAGNCNHFGINFGVQFLQN